MKKNRKSAKGPSVPSHVQTKAGEDATNEVMTLNVHIETERTTSNNFNIQSTDMVSNAESIKSADIAMIQSDRQLQNVATIPDEPKLVYRQDVRQFVQALTTQKVSGKSDLYESIFLFS